MVTLASCKSNNEQEAQTLHNKVVLLDSLFYNVDGDIISKMLDTLKKEIKKDDIENLSYYYYYRGLTTKDKVALIGYADTALSLFSKPKTQQEFPNAYIKALLLKSQVYLSFNRESEALEYYFIIKSLVNENLNPVDYAAYTTKIAEIYGLQHRYRQAAGYYLESFNVLNQSKNWGANNIVYLKQSSLNSAGYYYEKANVLDSAQLLYKRGLSYLDEEKSHHNITQTQLNQSKIVFLDNLGGVLAKKGQFEEALAKLEEAVAINAYSEERSKSTTYLKLANVYTHFKNYPKANIALNKADSLITQYYTDDYNLKPRLNKAKSEFFFAQNKFKQGSEFLKRYIQQTDSSNNASNDLAKMDLNSKFEAVRVKRDLKLLAELNEHKTMYLIFSGIFIVMLIPIILLAHKNAKQSKKNERQTARYSRQLEKAMKKLEEKNKDYAKMMKIMAHDLKNPISGMVVIANLLLMEENFNDDEKEMLQLIVTSGENSVEMIDQLLTSGLAVENEVLHKEKVDIRQLLRQCTELLNYKANDKNQRVSFVSHGNAEIMASREKIWRVFNNLIVNSIKFSPEGTIIKIVLEKLGSAVRIAVADQGIGIAEKDKEKIFEMFTEAKRPGTAGEQPFGIGLSISKQIIENHNGKIWLKDNPGGGTIFYVELPI